MNGYVLIGFGLCAVIVITFTYFFIKTFGWT